MAGKRGRPPASVPRDVRQNIIMTAAESALLDETAKMLNTSKTNAIIRGLHLLHQSCMAHNGELMTRTRRGD